MNRITDVRKPVALNRDSITQLVMQFYEDVRADSILGPTFEAALEGRWASHLSRMIEFWSTVALGSRSFTGNVFAKHMAVPGVTAVHFERWLHLWSWHTQALFDHATARRLQQAADGIARNLYRGYFGALPVSTSLHRRSAIAAIAATEQAALPLTVWHRMENCSESSKRRNRR